jgi:putative redox protein
MDVVDRIITLEGALTEEQRAKLLEIAERCPVHQTLQGKIQVNTRFG